MMQIHIWQVSISILYLDKDDGIFINCDIFIVETL